VQLDGAVALVSGGASGLGLASARRLRDSGCRVVIIDLPDSPGRSVAASHNLVFHPADVTDSEQVAAAVAAASDLGPVRVAVTCAGIDSPGRAVGRAGPLPLGDFERVVRVNLTGTFNVVRLAAAEMRDTDPVGGERGVIITTSSVAATDGQIGQVAYAASKAGVAALTLPLARELASSLIRVMSIAPGIFDTPMLAALPDAVRESLGAQVPHPARLGQPEEFAALVEHIVQNPMLNGETIRLDGAIRMAPR
jgi:NAD(P)-dependent dehydrogenase (short-subunit alcohol dehydrogenase family)